MKNLIIASTSTLFGGSYLDYLLPEIKKLFAGCSSIVFIPFARPSGISHEQYTLKVSEAFKQIGVAVKGLHEFEDKQKAIEDAEGIFTGGGNTFLLVDMLYQYQLIEKISNVVLNGTPYLGTSAGSNITGLTMQTTNDMPIVYPPSFQTLRLVPFNLNPHFLDPDSQSNHMGETRETRIKEFHVYNKIPVIGLREGSWLEVSGQKIILKGEFNAVLFERGKTTVEMEPGTDLSPIGA
jgi:dipeptidase E